MPHKKFFKVRKHDYYYKKAKKEGYRSRASYKLKYINENFGIIKTGDRILDLGAVPGGWSQVALEYTGSSGIVISVDIKKMEPLKGVIFIHGDFRKPEIFEKIKESLHKKLDTHFDVIISDASPNISGAYSYDHARSIELAETVLQIAKQILRQNGKLVMKVFDGDMLRSFLEKLKKDFEFVKIYKSKASRSQSSEVYIICKEFKGSL